MEKKEIRGHTLEFWKKNAEEDYLKVPISVLKYITILEDFDQSHPQEVSDEMIRNLIQKSRLLTENINGEDMPMFSEKYLINQFKQGLSLQNKEEVICDYCENKNQRMVLICEGCRDGMR